MFVINAVSPNQTTLTVAWDNGTVRCPISVVETTAQQIAQQERIIALTETGPYVAATLAETKAAQWLLCRALETLGYTNIQVNNSRPPTKRPSRLIIY